MRSTIGDLLMSLWSRTTNVFAKVFDALERRCPEYVDHERWQQAIGETSSAKNTRATDSILGRPRTSSPLPRAARSAARRDGRSLCCFISGCGVAIWSSSCRKNLHVTDKTHRRLSVSTKPLLPVPEEIIDASLCGKEMFLETSRGKPFSRRASEIGSATAATRQACRSARPTACVRLPRPCARKAGATKHQFDGAVRLEDATAAFGLHARRAVRSWRRSLLVNLARAWKSTHCRPSSDSPERKP